MEDRIMISNQEICNQIDTLLIQQGYKRQNIFNTVKGYTKEELNLVTTLYLECSETLDDLVNFPNLKILKIKSSNQDTVIEKDPFTVNSISDFSILSYLTNLEELTIVNDVNIKQLDITPLKKLTKIKLCNNPNLEKIEGLDKLMHLDNILIYANKKNPKINVMQYLENTKEAKKNYLDITAYFDMCEQNDIFEEVYKYYKDSYYTNLQFVEKVGIYNHYVPIVGVDTLYKRAKEVIKLIPFIDKFSSKDKIKFLYKYARTRIKYDYDTLNHRDTNSLLKALESKQKSYQFSMPNTSYSALVGRKTVCEGYSNMLHILYHMIGIESRVIYCSRPDEYINGLNHAALKIKYHDEYFYQDADPNWGNNNEEFFMVEKKEFEKTHVLAASEQQVESSDKNENDVKRYIK